MIFSRVTNSAMTNLFVADIQRNLASITDLQNQISTGKRVVNPSDDPVSADLILTFRQALDRIDQHIRNIGDTNSRASNIDGVLSTLEDVMMRARDLAVKGTNEAPQTQADLNPIAEEIDNLIGMVYAQSNQEYNGKFLFSGFKTDTSPFTMVNDLEYMVGGPAGPGTNVLTMPNSATGTQVQAITAADSVKDIQTKVAGVWTSLSGPGVTFVSDPITNTVTVNGAGNPFTSGTEVRVIFDKDVRVVYKGDVGEKNAEISEGSFVKASFAGAVSKDSAERNVFGSYSSNSLESNCVSSFQRLFDLRDNLAKYNAVNKTNINAIGQGITDVDIIRGNITDIRAELGGRVNRLELAANRLNDMKISTKSSLSDNEDVDMTEALSQLVLQQNVYQAALAAGAKIIQTTLLDYLR